MSTFLLILLIILGGSLLFAIYFAIKNYKAKKGKVKKEKVKKEKPIKKVEEKNQMNTYHETLFKGSSVDLDGKFLYRKEIKVLALVNHILPKGYIVFPKVGVDLILSPVGNRELYESIHSKYLDLVVFEETTMKPKIAIDLYDRSFGDEQLDVESPEVLHALQVAELPVLEIKIKENYKEEEIRDPIFKILGINDEDKS